MPIKYDVDGSKGVVFEYWSGGISAQDVSEHWARLLSDPDALACATSLADVRDAEPRLTDVELRRLVETIAVPILKGKSWKSAILVQKPVQFGMARQFHIFAEAYSKDAIFTDEKAARDWLGI